MDAMEQGLLPRKIYPQPVARGTIDSKGRLAGYHHGNEEVPQSEGQEEKWSLTIEEQHALISAHQAAFAAMCSAEHARWEAVDAAVSADLPAATE